MALPQLVRGVSCPRLVPNPWRGIRNPLQYGRLCPNQDSAHFNTEGKNLANTDEDAFPLHHGTAATKPGEDCARLNFNATIAAASFRLPACEQVRRKGALNRAPTITFIYAWRTPVLGGRPGPFHSSEIAFTFDNAKLRASVSFARTSNTNNDDLPHWLEYRSECQVTIQFDSQARNHPESGA